MIVDLFAGPGGWDEGAKPLGLAPIGIELAAAACATGEAAGHKRWQRDVAATDPAELAPLCGLIASPPCQGFSMAGKGKGRNDSAMLLRSIPHMRPHNIDAAIAWLHQHMTDDRSVLVLEPLRWAMATSPRWLAWEQVPAVLPLWEAMAEVLRGAGYSVATGLVHAEQHGVPQTRKRAILVARSDGKEARLPVPTHSRYHPRDPQRLDEGVLPWVSMAQALGWGMTERPYVTVATGTGAGGGTDPQALGGSGARRTVRREIDKGSWARMGDVYNAHGASMDNGNFRWIPKWSEDRPATTVVSNFRPDIIAGPGHHDTSRQKAPGSVRVDVWEAGVLQSFRPDYPWQGTRTQQFEQVGNAVPPLLARAILTEVLS